MKRAFLTLMAAGMGLSSASAAITTSGDFVNGTTTPMLTITEDIVIPVTATGSFLRLAFDEWMPTPGVSRNVLSVADFNLLSFRINDDPVQSVTISLMRVRRDAIDGALTPDNGYITMNYIEVRKMTS